jgi:6-phosphogluconolactonase
VSTGAPGPGFGLPELRVEVDADAVASHAATVIATRLAEAIATRGVAHLATTGGSAAPGIYRQLAVAPLRGVLDWSRVHVWWGDDRFVPADHPLSNVLPLTQILLASGGDEAGSGPTMSDVGEHGDGVEIPADHLHPVRVATAIGRGAGPEWAAAEYAAELAAEGPTADDDGTPVFDLVLVGAGPDGHVLSVFPGSAVWDESAICAAVPAPTHVEPHVPRVTLHPRVLAAARRVLLTTSGGSKAGIVAGGWAGGDVRELPVRAARLPTATWVLDVAAAAELPLG